ncbi:7 transmembrane receptor [Oesophagostomum dentatum]|uniref:7 transmembrane receptor n=1 Tax=Oesophagostomum dentatum TaxID=61180 RepID=A0A0B1TED1_OESDE|nr:7 transmembrane receptor [Oesophagostomum dentatum]
MCWDEEDGWRTCGCIVDLWILPIICFVGIVLNTCCLLVFTSHRSHPLVPALIVLSICDLLQLTLTVFVLCIPALHDYTKSDQFGAILRPLSSMHSPSRPFFPLVGIAIAALVFNSSKWAEYRFHWIVVKNDTKMFLAHDFTDLAHSDTYRRVRDHFLYPVLVYLGPLLLLCILNFRILSHISAQRVAFDHKSRLAQERRSVTLLISIIILFFVCHTGGLVIRFVDMSKYVDSVLFVLLKDCINLLFNINSMANPMLYFLFTRQFRDLRVSFRHFTPPRCGSMAVNAHRVPSKFVVSYPSLYAILSIEYGRVAGFCAFADMLSRMSASAQGA